MRCRLPRATGSQLVDVEFCHIGTAAPSNIAIVDPIWSQTSNSRHSRYFQVATRSWRATRPEGEVENTMTLRATLRTKRTKLHASIKSQGSGPCSAVAAWPSSRNPAPAIATPSFCQCGVSARQANSLCLQFCLFKGFSSLRLLIVGTISDIPRKGSLQLH